MLFFISICLFIMWSFLLVFYLSDYEIIYKFYLNFAQFIKNLIILSAYKDLFTIFKNFPDTFSNFKIKTKIVYTFNCNISRRLKEAFLYIYKLSDDIHRFNLCLAKRLKDGPYFRDASRAGLIWRSARAK